MVVFETALPALSTTEKCVVWSDSKGRGSPAFTSAAVFEAIVVGLRDRGSAIQAMQVLVDHGVQPSKILFLNMIASPEGLHNVWKAFPDVRVISAWVDTKLSDRNYILPGLGDYGDRYYSG